MRLLRLPELRWFVLIPRDTSTSHSKGHTRHKLGIYLGRPTFTPTCMQQNRKATRHIRDAAPAVQLLLATIALPGKLLELAGHKCVFGGRKRLIRPLRYIDLLLLTSAHHGSWLCHQKNNTLLNFGISWTTRPVTFRHPQRAITPHWNPN